MGQQQRYRRTERIRQLAAAHPDPGDEQYAEKRARYGSFTAYVVALLVFAAVVAVVAAVLLWPD